MTLPNETSDSGCPPTIEWVGGVDGHVRIIDQTQLPTRLVLRDCASVEDVWEAIRVLRVRGAPAIGIAAAMGVVLGVQKTSATAASERVANVRRVGEYLRSSRPTAVNLAWGVERMERRAEAAAGAATQKEFLRQLLDEALEIEAEDRRMCRAIGDVGAALVPDGAGVLTHCNAGGLATADYGTALAVIFRAVESGKQLRVFADETRPLLQGARLTAWELRRRGVDVTLICDNMAAQVMKEGRVQFIVVGADRIAANGDTANKIGTYGVAVLAKAHGIPFYVAAPTSTFDVSLATGEQIPIEQRDPREVTHGFGTATAPEGVAVYNPAFDVTPASLIAGIITERGLIRPVTQGNVRAVVEDPR